MTAAPDAASPAGNIDQIRDIIFGAQMRDYEQRFIRLEERLLKASADLRDDLTKRLTALEQFLQKETEALGAELKAEQKARVADVKELGAGHAGAAKASEQRFAKVEDLVARGQRELRGQLLDQSKSLGDELQRRHTEVTTALQKEAASLHAGKTDRTALAAMLADMAKKLAEDGKRQDHAGK
ncbi:MAG: hypothetical protein ABJD11_10960 [Gemmatimonadota bacterium]